VPSWYGGGVVAEVDLGVDEKFVEGWRKKIAETCSKFLS
jgi:hypothetical protein